MKFYDGLNEDDDNSESEDTETESSDGESKDQSSDSPKYPTVVMHCGAQNGFGGNTEDYAFCVYSEDDGEYILGGIDVYKRQIPHWQRQLRQHRLILARMVKLPRSL